MKCYTFWLFQSVGCGVLLKVEATSNIYNTRSSPMSSLFLTELPPISLCAHLLVLTFRTTAGYYTHVSELSS